MRVLYWLIVPRWLGFNVCVCYIGAFSCAAFVTKKTMHLHMCAWMRVRHVMSLVAARAQGKHHDSGRLVPTHSNAAPCM